MNKSMHPGMWYNAGVPQISVELVKKTPTNAVSSEKSMSILSNPIIITIRKIGPGKEKVSSPSVLVNPIVSFYLPTS